MGAWLSWLERAVHIREVIGSSPIAPIVLFWIVMGTSFFSDSFSFLSSMNILSGRP